MWCLGCVLAEMLSCSTLYVDKKMYRSKRRIMFQGKSCHPLSPSSKNLEAYQSGKTEELKYDSDDQIFKIMQRIVVAPKQDLAHLTIKSQASYIMDINSNIMREGVLKENFKKTGPGLLEIVKQLLEFNPYFRPSAK